MAEPDKLNAAVKSQGRGISYPYINLEEAIDKARAFYAEERKSSVPVVAAMKHFGYGEKSGGGRQTVSALIQFGLMEDEGIKENRLVKLTDRALQILLDEPNSPARLAAIKEAARFPKIYLELMTKWGDELPSDHTISYYLQKDKDFNPKTLHSFISDFRSSIAFAKLNDKGTITSAVASDLDKKPPIDLPKVKVGDSVQWETNGSIQFKELPQVTGISEDHQFVFVTGSQTGLPINEVTIMQSAPPNASGQTPPANSFSPPPLKLQSGARQDVFSLDEGSVVLQWPEKMSQDSYDDFEAWMQIQLRKIKRSIN